MFRIDGPGATEDNKFTEGDPASGTRATFVTAEWLNSVQEEIAAAIEEDGLVLEKADSALLSRVLGRRVIHLRSIAALVDETNPKDGAHYFVSGYHPGNEAGGGIFYYDKSRAKADHNAGTVIDPDKTFPADWSVLADVQEWLTPSTSGTGVFVRKGAAFSLEDFGLLSGSVDYAEANSKVLEFAFSLYKQLSVGVSEQVTDYYFDIARWVSGSILNGVGSPNFYFTEETSPVAVSFRSDSQVDGVTLRGMNTTTSFSRFSFEVMDGSTVRNVGFFDNNPTESPGDGQGAYFKDAKNISLYDCLFGNNKVYDISVVEEVFNLNIYNARTPDETGVFFAVEPNVENTLVDNVNVFGGHFRKVLFLCDLFNNKSIGSVVFNGAQIDELSLPRSQGRYDGCSIGAIASSNEGIGVFSGELSGDSFSLGPELIDDTRFFNYALGATVTDDFWKSVSSLDSFNDQIVRYADPDTGELYVSFNDSNSTGPGRGLVTREKIPVTAGEAYSLAFRARQLNSGLAGTMRKAAKVSWYDGADSLISENEISGNYAPSGTDTEFRDQVAVVQAPTGAVSCEVTVGKYYQEGFSGKLQFNYVSFRHITPDVNGNFDRVMSEITQPVTQARDKRSAFPSTQKYINYMVGDFIENSDITAGGVIGWRCVEAGSPGTWKSVGTYGA